LFLAELRFLNLLSDTELFQESNWQRLEAEVTKKRHDERLIKLTSDMRFLKREMMEMKREVHKIAQTRGIPKL
jgi:hypothetical protein